MFRELIICLLCIHYISPQSNGVLTPGQQITPSQTCEDITPTTANDCTKVTRSNGDYCCYIEGMRNYSNEKKCITIPKTAYTGKSTVVHNDRVYTMTCPVATYVRTPLLKCGTGGQSSQEECSTFSSFAESCCYFDGVVEAGSPVTAEKGCYWLGNKYYKGRINWATMELNCNGEIIKLSLMALMLALSVLLF